MYNISQKMSAKIERLQKVALYILLGRNADKDYFVNLSMLDLDTLKDRRDKIAEKCRKSAEASSASENVPVYFVW